MAFTNACGAVAVRGRDSAHALGIASRGEVIGNEVRLRVHQEGVSQLFEGVVWSCWARWALAICLFLLTCCSRLALAYYPPEIVLTNDAYMAHGVTGTGYMIVANNRFDATCMALGWSYDRVQDISALVRSKASNASTGGRFYTLAESAWNYATAYPPNWAVGSYDFIETWGNVAGKDRLWFINATKEDYAAAKEDLNVLLNGGSLGGGGTGETDELIGIENLVAGTEYVYTAITDTAKEYGSLKFTVNEALISALKSKVENGKFYCWARQSSTNAERYNIYIYYASDNIIFNINKDNGNIRLSLKTNTDSNKAYYRYITGVTPNNGIVNFTGSSVSTNTISSSEGSYLGDFVWNFNLTGDDSGSGGGTPENNWPDAPTVDTEPPEVPSPSAPTGNEPVEPTPVSPDKVVVTPTARHYSITVTTWPQFSLPDFSDILDILRMIYYELAQINDMLPFYLDQLVQEIYQTSVFIQNVIIESADMVADSVYNAIAMLGDTVVDTGKYIVSGIATQLDDSIYDLESYLKRLFEWLAEQMQWESEGYDDSSVIYWLRKIYNKQTYNGSKPDPISDPEGTWNWLDNLITNLLADLMAAGSELVADVAELISEIMTKFPLSIPWDIAALLGLFAAPALTPEFTTTLDLTELLGVTVPIEIDLSPYDEAMGVVRTVELIGFTLYLLIHTKDIIAIFDWTGV